MMSDAGRLDEKLLALLDEALERIGPERTARRAALLSAKSAEMYWVDNDLMESTQLVDEAIEIAREVDAPASLAAALQRKIFIPTGPGAARERLAIAEEMLELGSATGDREAVLRGHAYRLWSSLELGDVGRGRPGAERPTPGSRTSCGCRSTPGTPSRCAGMRVPARREDRGGRAACRARRGGQVDRAEQPLAEQYYGIQMTQIRSMQGRAGELLPAVRDLAERFPGIPAWRGGVITLAARSGDVELARRELERFAGDDFSAIPRDANWIAGNEPAGGGDRADRRRRTGSSRRTRSCSPMRAW